MEVITKLSSKSGCLDYELGSWKLRNLPQIKGSLAGGGTAIVNFNLYCSSEVAFSSAALLLIYTKLAKCSCSCRQKMCTLCIITLV